MIYKNKWFLLILLLLFLQIAVNVMYPTTAYAMDPNSLYNCDADYCDNINHIHEARNYPFGSDSSSYGSIPEIPEVVFFKSKIVWFFWKRYTHEYNSLSEFERSLNGSFKIRDEFKKDLKKDMFKLFPKR